MRLFVAIEIPDNIRSTLQGFNSLVHPNWVDDVRYVRPENRHITVKFFGEVSEVQLPVLTETLGGLRCEGPLKLQLSKVECFPNHGPVATIAIGLAGDIDRLTRFHKLLESACEGLGFPSERRAYVPHITIARARPPLPSYAREVLRKGSLPRRANQDFFVDEFVLFQSQLKPDGPEYIRLATFPLMDPDAV